MPESAVESTAARRIVPRRNAVRALAALAFLVLLSAWYTDPLLRERGTLVASDAGDPVLNASILWWNATTVPLSRGWWSPPFFYPSEGIAAFTEHLLGVSVVGTPVYWATGNALTTYNLAVFVSWPLSAFCVYLLVAFLTDRQDAALLAGVSWAFSPFRLTVLGHLQSLSAYWMPLMLLGLHGYLLQRRPRWLVIFGAAWILQSLANNYYMLFAAVLIVLWLAYFCSRSQSWRAAGAIVAAWAAASLPLVPILVKYVQIHEQFGLRRSLTNPVGFSTGPWAFAQVAPGSWLGMLLRTGEHNLYPGLVMLMVALAGCVACLWELRERAGDQTAPRRALRFALASITLLSCVAALTMAVLGPWQVAIAGATLRMTTIDRALVAGLVCGVSWLLLTRGTRAALARRSPLLFYVAAMGLFALLACGPVVLSGAEVILDPAPYRWLMAVPGFDRLRVPARFWMVGTLCLSIAGGLSFAKFRARQSFIAAAGVVLAALMMAEGWLGRFPMAGAPSHWPRVERADQSLPILELPLGPEFDGAATFRSIRHRRRVANGVSGYDPPHYAPLQAGLNARDPGMLVALASLGALDVVVDGEADRDGSWAAYASSAPGVAPLATDGIRSAFRVPQAPPVEAVVGDPLPLSKVWAFEAGAEVTADGLTETSWQNGPQRPDQWMIADLGAVREVGGVTHALGDFARDFPRRLAIDLSVDGATWKEVWTGRTAALAFLAAARAPRAADMRFSFPSSPARFIRLRQMDYHVNDWRVAELRVHAGEAR